MLDSPKQRNIVQHCYAHARSLSLTHTHTHTHTCTHALLACTRARTHACTHFSPDSFEFSFEDLGSTNGVFLNEGTHTHTRALPHAYNTPHLCFRLHLHFRLCIHSFIPLNRSFESLTPWILREVASGGVAPHHTKPNPNPNPNPSEAASGGVAPRGSPAAGGRSWPKRRL